VPESLGAAFEVRVTGPGGERRLAAAAPVVAESDFAELADRAGESPAEEETAAAPQAACGLDPQTHKPRCTFYFERFRYDLTDSDWEALKDAAVLARQSSLKVAVIDGFADHEGGRDVTDQLSQERADAVLKALMEQNAGMASVTAQGWADTRPAEGGDDTRAYAKNRRVELRFDEAAP
jgi:outer membrane protein OmpA-like peptidoglycan-associated protein